LPYHVQVTREDLDRLESFPHISAGKLVEILDDVWFCLANVTDQDRSDRRLGAGSPYFLFDWVFQDESYGHRLLFYVDDSHAAAGVLVVTFVDHQLGPAI
jgi:hypothetical protein